MRFADAHVVQWQVAQLSHKACCRSDVLDSLFWFKIVETMLPRLDTFDPRNRFIMIMIISKCLEQSTLERRLMHSRI